MEYEFDAEVVRWDARPTMFLLTLPAQIAAEIDEIPRPPGRFNSLRVLARIGGTEWRTSIFRGRDSTVLPLNKAVRSAETLDEGDIATVQLTLLDL